MAVITNFGVPTDNASATLMPKLQYRFKVEFEGMGSGGDGMPLVTTNVISVTRPQLDHEDITLDTYNSKIRLAGKHTWSDITLVLRDDMDGNVIKSLDHQLSKQVNHSTQASAKSGADYKFKMSIITLDGSFDNDSNGAAVLDKWELVGCFIPSIQYGDLNYSTSDMVQVTATIRYDNASHTILQSAIDELTNAGIVAGGESSATTDGAQ
jgi:hypothetical protein